MTNLLTVPRTETFIDVKPKGFSAIGLPGMIVVGLLLIGVAVVPLFPDVRFYYVQVIILVFFFATLGTAWGITGGYSGLHSVGHAAFVGIGAYTSTLLWVDHGVSPWIGMLIGMAIASIVAVVIGYATFRFGLRGDYFTLATVALGQLAYEIVNGLPQFTRGSQGIPISFIGDAPLLFQFEDRRVYFYIAMVLWLVTVFVSYRVRRSRAGFRMLAVRDDEAAAARGGISVVRSKLISFVVSAAITAAAGTFYAQFYLFIDPGAVMSLALSVQIILISALGGMNSFLGGTIGAVILIPVSQALSTQLAGFNGADLAIYGVVLVLVMMYMPHGILGPLRKSERWRRVIGW